jgi:hypothetical protein
LAPANSERQRPRYLVSPVAKPRKVKGYSERGRKPELRRTAWAGRWRGAASVREIQHLMLTRPRDRRVEEAGDADPLGQSTVDRGFDEARCEEGQRDRHMEDFGKSRAPI